MPSESIKHPGEEFARRKQNSSVPGSSRGQLAPLASRRQSQIANAHNGKSDICGFYGGKGGRRRPRLQWRLLTHMPPAIKKDPTNQRQLLELQS